LHSRLLARFLLIGVVSALVFAPGQSHPARAQGQTDIKLTAHAGFEGFCKEESWIPVQVSVENTGPDVTARIQASYRNGDGGQSIYAADISLPTTSRKELFLYLYPQGILRKLSVSLVAEGDVLATTDLRVTCLSRENLLIGLVADDPSSFDILNEVKPLGGFVRVARLQLADLPDRAQGWSGLDALVVSGVDTGSLTPGQLRALAAWLANGGKLLVIGGPQWQSAASGLGEFLPVEPSSTAMVSSLSGLQSYFREAAPLDGQAILAVGRVSADTNVLARQEDLPVLLERQIGFGRVIYLAVDPSLQPLSDWVGIKAVYSHLLGVAPVRPEWANGVWETYSADRAVSTLAELNLPSFVYICGWLLLYVVVIGPLNFVILRRAKRRERAWLTIPLIVFVFSGIAYFYGSVYRGQHPILNRIALVQAWQGSEMAQAKALVGIYSPRRAKYALEAGDGFALYPFESNSGGLQSGEGWLSLQDGEKTVMPDVRVEIGGMKAVALQGSLPALEIDHALVISISEKDPMLTGTVTNLSGFTLHGAMLVTSGRWQRLGDLAPGASASVRVSLTPDSDGPEFYGLESNYILGVNGSEQDEGVIRREATLQALLRSGYGQNLGNWGVYLMGWLDQPLLPVNVRGEAFETIDTTLYVAMLVPSVQLGSTTWKLTPSLLAWESSVEGASPYHSEGIPTSGYLLRFRPAIPIQFGSVQELTLDINTSYSTTPADISASLWDFESGLWSRLEDLHWGRNNIPEPERYVGPGGEIQLKISGSGNDYIELDPSSFTLVVKP